jgi:uncharacterized protein
MTLVLAGFVLGVAGSVHCLLMCGPLVLAAQGASGFRRRWLGVVAYHAGRLLTYQLAAMLASLAAHVFIPGGFQRAFSVVCGLILLAGVLPASLPPSTRVVARPWLRPILRGSAWAGRIAGARPTASRFVGGLLNGLLPCGLTYAAVVMSAASGSVVSAALVMAGFGAGTLPALLGLSAAARPWAVLVPRLRLVTPLVVATVGFVLLLRGLLPPQSAHTSRHVAGVHLLHRPGSMLKTETENAIAVISSLTSNTADPNEAGRGSPVDVVGTTGGVGPAWALLSSATIRMLADETLLNARTNTSASRASTRASS